MVVCSKLGMNFVACGPKHCMPGDDVVEACKPIAAENGCTILLTDDPKEAAPTRRYLHRRLGLHGRARRGLAERIKELEPYRVTAELMALAKPEAIFLHCLPAFHDTNTTIGAQKAEQFGITRWKLPTRSSSRSSPRSSTRLRTVCTPSRLSCTPP